MAAISAGTSKITPQAPAVAPPPESVPSESSKPAIDPSATILGPQSIVSAPSSDSLVDIVNAAVAFDGAAVILVRSIADAEEARNLLKSVSGAPIVRVSEKLSVRAVWRASSQTAASKAKHP